MQKLRKQIKESFFNPILHFLPLLLFLVLDEFYGMDKAWKFSFPLALLLVFYVFYFYNRIFHWHLIFTFMYMGVGIVASLATLIPLPDFFQHLTDKLVVLLFVGLSLIFKKQIQQNVLRIVSRIIPMSNNFDELFRVLWGLLLVLSGYVFFALVITFFANSATATPYLNLLRWVYLGVLFFLTVYEILRVQLIRAKLLREEWWPIVNENGKIIGSIQHLTSLNDEKKYMHPIVRVMLIDKGLVFLQKRATDNLVFGGLWDTAVSNHLVVDETIEQCIERTARERYGLENFKYMHLSNYVQEAKNEHHYAFLFVSCQLAEVKPNPTFVENTKWWTQQQIEENLESGIFSENFKVEYDLVKRSGLLESGKCECKCKLKEVIYEQPNQRKTV